jgi:hypothetical protein
MSKNKKSCQTTEMLKYIANVIAAEIPGVRRKLWYITTDG